MRKWAGGGEKIIVQEGGRGKFCVQVEKEGMLVCKCEEVIGVYREWGGKVRV